MVTTKIETDVKTCPFCDAMPIIDEWSMGMGDVTYVDKVEKKYKFQIACIYHQCSINPRTNWYMDKNDAIKAWNKRSLGQRSGDER